MADERIEREDALKHLRACEERGTAATLESLAGALAVPARRAGELLGALLAAGQAESAGGRYGLTAEGRRQALQLVRAHRLWETYLARRTAVPEFRWHREAHAAEHRMTPAEVDALAQALGYPRFDPHGDPIPRRDGTMAAPERVALSDLAAGWEGTLAHVEDEPESVYSRLVAEGFAAGMRLKLLERGPVGLRVNLEGRVVELSLVEAASLECAAQREPAETGEGLDGAAPVMRLSDLREGETGRVEALTPQCRGAERRRLLDLGLVPGSRVTVDFAGPFRSPRAYYVRGTLVGLRREQADLIIVRAETAAAAEKA